MSNPIVVEKLTQYPDGRKGKRHCYWCPGCDSLHCIAINPVKADNGAGWEFAGTLECPTYSPSQLSTWEGLREGIETKEVCHTWIKAGMIEFLSDCTHQLKGQTVPLPPLPDWVVDDGKGEADGQ